MKRHILALSLALTCTGAFAAGAEVAPPNFNAARQQFMAGSGGDSGARDAAIESFQKMAVALPGHPLLPAYEGAATAIRGRDAMMPWDKMKYAEKGADMVEKAVAQLGAEHDEALFNGTPESIETRMVAVNTLLALPEFMHRRASGKRILQAALASPALAQAAPAVRAGLFSTAARVAGEEKRSADEVAYLRQVVALNTQHAAKAAARLKELEQ